MLLRTYFRPSRGSDSESMNSIHGTLSPHQPQHRRKEDGMGPRMGEEKGIKVLKIIYTYMYVNIWMCMYVFSIYVCAYICTYVFPIVSLSLEDA